jgi:hypothetical protein
MGARGALDSASVRRPLHRATRNKVRLQLSRDRAAEEQHFKQRIEIMKEWSVCQRRRTLAGGLLVEASD